MAECARFCDGSRETLTKTLTHSSTTTNTHDQPTTQKQGPDGELLFHGPRVRMAVHWARDGTIVHRLQSGARGRMFAGPAMSVAQEVGDAAHGGQVLLTQVCESVVVEWLVVGFFGGWVVDGDDSCRRRCRDGTTTHTATT